MSDESTELNNLFCEGVSFDETEGLVATDETEMDPEWTEEVAEDDVPEDGYTHDMEGGIASCRA